MGSPLGPALDNLFKGYYKNKKLNSKESSTGLSSTDMTQLFLECFF